MVLKIDNQMLLTNILDQFPGDPGDRLRLLNGTGLQVPRRAWTGRVCPRVKPLAPTAAPPSCPPRRSQGRTGNANARVELEAQSYGCLGASCWMVWGYNDSWCWMVWGILRNQVWKDEEHRSLRTMKPQACSHHDRLAPWSGYTTLCLSWSLKKVLGIPRWPQQWQRRSTTISCPYWWKWSAIYCKHFPKCTLHMLLYG